MSTKRFKTPAVMTATALALGISLSACGGTSGASTASDCTPKHQGIKTVAQGKLTIGVIDIPPFSSYNSGTPNGIDLAIINKIAKDECLQPAFQQATYADAVQSISGGNIDLAVGTIDATEKRLKAVDFSASTYLDGMGIASKTGATTVAELEKMNKVGTIDGYLWVEDLKKILGDKLVTYPSSVELKADFDAGRLDADVDAYGVQVLQFKDASGITVALSNDKPDPRVGAITHAPEAAFPITKGNTSLKEALDAGITSQRQDGTIAKLLKDAGLSEGLGKVADKQYVVPAS
ncbi:transporter substrate-binding domain-containing protein [Pseudarthrobacter sp. H3Y2-7]|jgi:polar amino acid transport system substrate-binding protein|uniref:substrate-binding periplasmic protein n=1 Tax=Pseudarthrobacter naphthalenicus TaxID=3031328 RepID=UPI0023B1BBDF|nr:transporter substrate-binding domain-containing protein [Pseudarthrobacter sp. H3Y2-7]MDE8667692.1 transporter substrate-binding domain-containing protein [Pseudarthrobacter sp. H3Y2-7]